MNALRSHIAKLSRIHKAARVPSDPLHIILQENIGYLVSDEKRAELFATFEDRIGLNAAAIARASTKALFDIAKNGGMRPEQRVERWRSIAEITLREASGDLRATLKSLPVAKARALLKKFPVIGDPGADKILLFSGIDVRPALDSNGLRALLRLGVCEEQASYAASYRAAILQLKSHGKATKDWYVEAFSALRAHGQTLCRRAEPVCLSCPLDAQCGHVAIKLAT